MTQPPEKIHCTIGGKEAEILHRIKRLHGRGQTQLLLDGIKILDFLYNDEWDQAGPYHHGRIGQENIFLVKSKFLYGQKQHWWSRRQKPAVWHTWEYCYECGQTIKDEDGD